MPKNTFVIEVESEYEHLWRNPPTKLYDCEGFLIGTAVSSRDGDLRTIIDDDAREQEDRY